MNTSVPAAAPGAAFLDQALAHAREAAAAAADVIARYYRRDLAVETKADATPVTIADREAEREIKRVLKAHYPQHGYHGEEFGIEQGASEFRWLIDPIDGTKSFVRGYPFFSTQIALMHRGELVLGVSSASQFGETAWARRGGGAFLNGEHVHVGSVATVEAASLSFGNLKTLAGGARWLKLAALVQRAQRTRGYGDFYHYHLLARASADAVIESDVDILDIAALVVIVREAGGVFTDLEGRPVTLGTRSVLAATPGLHPILLEALDGDA
jgi:histidinol-phosphatase